MPPPIIDERTLAAWFSGPTEQRAEHMRAEGLVPRACFAEVEEHVLDPATGTTLRCDVTVRNGVKPILTVEMKRPELVDVESPVLTEDAHSKALTRGLPLYATSNFAEIALWRTEDGPQPPRPLERLPLAIGLWHSSAAPSRRQEMQSNWRVFLDHAETQLEAIDAATARAVVTLPPQVADLREALKNVAEEAASRIAAAASADVAFRDRVISIFGEQFGVEFSLDPARPDILDAEARQVASIACFIVAARLLLYQALSFGDRGEAKFELDRIEVPLAATDPKRIAHELTGLYAHARARTHDFELQFTPSFLDEIAFVPSPSGAISDVGSRWASLIDVVVGSDWTGPSQYVPVLYESLLDEEHRHLMGVHYTPGSLAEVVAAYAIHDAADVVMDPAAGAGTFATISYDRKRALGSTHEDALAEVYAVEIADFAASLTGLSLALADTSAPSAYPRVVKSDFFALVPGGPTGLSLPDAPNVHMPQAIDAVVGNPPYVRFESRSPDERAEIHAVLAGRFAREGIAFPDFTGKADLWAFFVAQSHAYLKEGGRLAFVLSWALLCSNYGDAVLSFLSRYFLVDAIVDSRVERFFAAKQHVVLLLARRAQNPDPQSSATANPHVDSSHLVRFVRLKRPLASLLRSELRRGKQAEDMVDELMTIATDIDDDPRWDVHVVAQDALGRRQVGLAEMTEDVVTPEPEA